MLEMPSWIAGRRRGRLSGLAPAETAPSSSPLATLRVKGASTTRPQSLGRRDSEFGFERIFIPSLIIDHTELALRQAGVCGNEGFAIWAGTLAGGDAYVATLIIPRSCTGPTHGEISANTTANVLNALDDRDLVPVLQLHSHPRTAFLSDTDAQRPLVAVPGFISVVVPDFGFVDLTDLSLWSAHEFLGPHKWHELDVSELRRRIIIDDSVLRVD